MDFQQAPIGRPNELLTVKTAGYCTFSWPEGSWRGTAQMRWYPQNACSVPATVPQKKDRAVVVLLRTNSYRWDQTSYCIYWPSVVQENTRKRRIGATRIVNAQRERHQERERKCVLPTDSDSQLFVEIIEGEEIQCRDRSRFRHGVAWIARQHIVRKYWFRSQ